MKMSLSSASPATCQCSVDRPYLEKVLRWRLHMTGSCNRRAHQSQPPKLTLKTALQSDIDGKNVDLGATYKDVPAVLVVNLASA